VHRLSQIRNFSDQGFEQVGGRKERLHLADLVKKYLLVFIKYCRATKQRGLLKMQIKNSLLSAFQTTF